MGDDHHVVRHGLLEVLHGAPGIEVVGEAAEIQELLGKVFALSPRVLALDLRLPGCCVCDTIRRLRAEIPETEIVVLTMHQSAGVARRALDAGAIGVVLKDRADTELPRAIRDAAEAREYVSPGLARCASAPEGSSATTPAG